MNNTTNITSLTNIQFLSVCNYINSFCILFNKSLIANSGPNQTEPFLNSLFQFQTKSNSSEVKLHLSQKTLQATNLFQGGMLPRIEMRYANKIYQFIINSALFSFYKNITRFFNKTDKSFASFGQNLFQYFSKRAIKNFSMLGNFSSKLTARTTANFYDYILPFFTGIHSQEQTSNEQRKELPMLKRFKRHPGGTSVNNDIGETDFRLQQGSSLTETTETNNHTIAEKELMQALSSLAREQYQNELNIEDVLETLMNDQDTVDNVGDNIRHNSPDIVNGTGRRRPDFLEDIKEKSGVNVVSKESNKLQDDSGIAAKIRKLNSRKDNSSNTMESDKNSNNAFTETLEERAFPSPIIRDSAPKVQADYNFINTLRNLKDKGLTAVKQNKCILKQFRIDLNNLAVQYFERTLVHEPMKLWFRETTDKPNVVHILSNLQGKVFFFNDITLLTKINYEVLPWETLRQNSFDLPDEEFQIYYFISINSGSGFLQLTDDRTSEDLYIVFPDVMFTVQQTEISENTKTLVLKLKNVKLCERQYILNRQKELKLLSSEEKDKTKRLKYIEKAAEIISSNLPMHTFVSAVEILKRYVLKLEESETVVPTYDQLAEAYCNNSEALSTYEDWKIPHHEIINDVLFSTNFDKKITYNNFKRKFKKKFKTKDLQVKNKKLYDEYKSSSVMQKSARIEDFVYLNRFINNNYYVDRTNSKYFLTSVCLFALRQCEEDFTETRKTFKYVKYVSEINVRNYNNIRKVELDIEVLALEEQVDINNLSYASGVLRRPRFITLVLENNAGLVNVDRITKRITGKYILAPGLTFEVISHEFINTKNILVQVVKLWNFQTKERKMIDIIRKVFKILN